jgi:hypothetical protein
LLVGSVVKIGKLRGHPSGFLPAPPDDEPPFRRRLRFGGLERMHERRAAPIRHHGLGISEKSLWDRFARASPYSISAPKKGKATPCGKRPIPYLKPCPALNFVGNMEARELTSGDYDVVACDGFSATFSSRATEGTGIGLLKLLKKTFFKNFKNKMGALFLKKDIYAIKDFMDYNNYGGAVMLGFKKIVIKGHGSGNSALGLSHASSKPITPRKTIWWTRLKDSPLKPSKNNRAKA